MKSQPGLDSQQWIWDVCLYILSRMFVPYRSLHPLGGHDLIPGLKNVLLGHRDGFVGFSLKASGIGLCCVIETTCSAAKKGAGSKFNQQHTQCKEHGPASGNK